MNIFINRFLAFFICCVLAFEYGYSQKLKPVIDFEAVENWDKIGEAYISDNANFVAYQVESKSKDNNKLVIKSVFGKFLKSIPEASFVGFEADRYCKFKNQRGSIFKLDLSNGNTISVPKIPPGSKFQNAQRSTGSTFLTKNEKGITSVYLDRNDGKQIKLVDDSLLQLRYRMRIVSPAGSLISGTTRLCLGVIDLSAKNSKLLIDSSGVIIWAYNDTELQTQQMYNINKEQYYTGLLIPGFSDITVLDDRKNTIIQIGDHFWLRGKRSKLTRMAGHWPSPIPKQFDELINGNTGEIRKVQMDSTANKSLIGITPDSEYIIYFNEDDGDYYSYNIDKAVTTNLTFMLVNKCSTLENILVSSQPKRTGEYTPYGNVRIDADGSFLVYDQYDIWKLSPSLKYAPICLTAGFGRKNGLILRVMRESIEGLTWNGGFLLSAFSPKSKQSGIFSHPINKVASPFKIVLENRICVNYNPNIGYVPEVKKAKNKNWLLYQSQSAESSPNWFITDGKKSIAVSDVNPEKRYNWLTSELISWKTSRGIELQGILYKPEDFDSEKKYPVIVQYYEKLSDGLHAFIEPKLSAGNINIPWLTSRGYLVFQPDISYTIGEQGNSALECIESGTDEIGKRKYVDKTRIGISGHSWGGYETLYLITHSNKYVAALAAAGASNYISLYNSLAKIGRNGSQGRSRQIEREIAQGGIPATLWDRTELYIANSPIFYADKVSTPLLLMHNQKDNSGHPFEQSMEFFLAMHRMGKPCWLLEYENENHLLYRKEAMRDYTIRATQFFDHYLKGVSTPNWMLDGLPVKDRQFKTGYDLDTLGRTPVNSPNIDDNEQKLIDDYSKIPFEKKIKRLFKQKK